MIIMPQPIQMIKQLESLTTAELVEVKKLTEKLIRQSHRRAKSSLKKEIWSMVKERGLRIQDLSLNAERTGDVNKKPKKVFPVKYRNPQKPTETWTGLGKTPLWVRACLQDGMTLEQLLVAKK
jgi:DNA-binding protein H-NS